MRLSQAWYRQGRQSRDLDAGYSEWALAYFALMRVGAIIVPVNTGYRPEEIEYVLNKSRASLLVLKEERTKIISVCSENSALEPAKRLTRCPTKGCLILEQSSFRRTELAGLALFRCIKNSRR
jgi:acyl-CoA synthetase (AMP-forming)/AMP-acid ligase II